ncbi:uncharacterized protein LOC131041821 isoform X1 [Cryptomeria japonica]|uniref:uncharacterized protein LOC131041821 isoform X1 n=1 Tax=Cryptomeria japonica TaxID=3369 RepID=UPI0025ACF01D|nr:uncharacterized protein LOC131041821 isoform X1 [Cryptomeria japonica]
MYFCFQIDRRNWTIAKRRFENLTPRILRGRRIGLILMDLIYVFCCKNAFTPYFQGTGGDIDSTLAKEFSTSKWGSKKIHISSRLGLSDCRIKFAPEWTTH